MPFVKTRKAHLSFSTDNDRWAAVVRRDPSAVGTFYYSVRTTAFIAGRPAL